jgi:hypothetical protein
MRQPTPSFLSDLRAYHDHLTKKNQLDWKDKIALELVQRWLERDDAEEIWRNLKSALPADLEIKPVQFAEEVIGRRILAERAAEIVHSGGGLVEDVKRRLKHHLAKDDIAKVHAISGVLKSFQERRGRALARQKGADQTWFMWQWSEAFKMVCGRPLDELVAALTEIAFDLEDVGVDHVRGAQRTMKRLREKQDTRRTK